MLALQRSTPGFDGQISYFTRYNNLHFIPDPIGDLLFNGIASDVSRQSYTNGIQGDASYVVNAAHTLRAGFTVSAEKAWVDNTSLVEACGPACDGTDNVDAPISDHRRRRQARLARRRLRAGRVEDHQPADHECRPALRPDVAVHQRQSVEPAVELHLQAVREHHVPRRLCALFHAAGAGRGGARQYRVCSTTPPGRRMPARPADPVLPERSHYFDAGVVQKIPFGCYGPTSHDCSNLEIGLDAYYKIATDLIDNGQFGQALVLSALQLPEGHQRRHRVQPEIHQRQFPGLRQSRGGAAEGRPTWCRTNICSTIPRRSPISAA